MSTDLAKRGKQRVSRDKRGRAWGIQCTASRRDGQQCTRWAIQGGWVCIKHGGQLPVVRAAARARLLALLPAAILALEELASQSDDKAVRLRAAKEILRVNGIKSTQPTTDRGVAAARMLPSGEKGGPSLDDEIEALIQGALESGAPSD